MNKNKYLIKNSALFALGNIGTKLINFFLVPLYTYVLREEEYGSVDLMFTICSLIIPLVMCNINEAVMRFMIDKDQTDDEVASVGLVFMVMGILSGVFFIPLFLLFDVTKEYAIHMYCYIIFNAAHSVTFYYLRGKEKLLLYAIGSILTTFIVAILNIVFLVVLKWGINGYFLAYNLSYLLTTVFAIIAGKSYKVIFCFSLNYRLLRQMLTFSIALVPNSLLWWMMNSSDRIMVSAMVGLGANGLYSVSYKIPSLLNTFSHIFMQAWTYSAIREKNDGGSGDYNNYIFDKMFGLMILVSGGLILALKLLFRVLFSRSYFEAWKFSPFLIVGFFFLTMGTFIGTTYYVEKNTVGTMLSALFGAIINIILNFILIVRIGANGAALATCLSYISVFIYRMIDTRKYLKLNIINAKNISSVLCLLLMSVTVYVDTSILSIWLLFEFIALCLIQIRFIASIIHGGRTAFAHLISQKG